MWSGVAPAAEAALSSLCSLHHNPQADHVRAHVPENADVPNRRGWALGRRAAATACSCESDATDLDYSKAQWPLLVI